MPEQNDITLVKRTLKGDKRSFESLVVRYQVPVYNTAYRMLQNKEEAQDIAQEAWLRSYRSLRTFKRNLKFRVWLFKITTNLCVDRLRSGTNRTVSTDEEDAPQIPDDKDAPDVELESKDIRMEVQRAINSLPEHYRSVVILRHLQDCAYEEIAEILDIPTGTVMGRLFRERKILQSTLKDLI